MPALLLLLLGLSLFFVVTTLLNVKTGEWWKHLIGAFGCLVLFALLRLSL